MKWKVGKDLYQYEMYWQLECDAAAYLPLKACTVHWGARMILAKHWQNVEQGQLRASKKSDIFLNNQTSTDQDEQTSAEDNISNKDTGIHMRLNSGKFISINIYNMYGILILYCYLAKIEKEIESMNDYVEHNLR